MSPDPVPRFLEETWQWKRESQEATRGMTTEEVIEYFRRAAREFQERTGIRLPEAEEPVERRPAQRAPGK
jgi:hypothetical protein